MAGLRTTWGSIALALRLLARAPAARSRSGCALALRLRARAACTTALRALPLLRVLSSLCEDHIVEDHHKVGMFELLARLDEKDDNPRMVGRKPQDEQQRPGQHAVQAILGVPRSLLDHTHAAVPCRHVGHVLRTSVLPASPQQQQREHDEHAHVERPADGAEVGQLRP